MATATGWVVGFVVGLLFAALSYLYYWFAIVWIGATAGYAAGTGIMAWLTPNLDIVTFIVGLLLAAAFAAIFIVLRVPKFLAIGFTAFGGAFAVMAGIALSLGRVPEAADPKWNSRPVRQGRSLMAVGRCRGPARHGRLHLPVDRELEHIVRGVQRLPQPGHAV